MWGGWRITLVRLVPLGVCSVGGCTNLSATRRGDGRSYQHCLVPRYPPSNGSARRRTEVPATCGNTDSSRLRWSRPTPTTWRSRPRCTAARGRWCGRILTTARSTALPLRSRVDGGELGRGHIDGGRARHWTTAYSRVSHRPSGSQDGFSGSLELELGAKAVDVGRGRHLGCTLGNAEDTAGGGRRVGSGRFGRYRGTVRDPSG